MRSVVCCKGRKKKPISFATITHAKQTKMVQIVLVGSPCCDKEYQSFIQLLDNILQTINPVIDEYTLLYDISDCSFNSKYMKEQEDRLDKIQTCAIVTNDIIVRKIISVIIKRKQKINNKSNVKIVADKVSALKWLLSHQ